MYDVAFVGGGVLSITCAVDYLRHHPGSKILVISNNSQHSASTAAGAMLNILSEVDWFNKDSKLMNWKLSVKPVLLGLWNDIDSFLSSYFDIQSFLFGKQTLVKKLKSSTNKVEINSFDSIRSKSAQFNSDVSFSSDNDSDYISILDEPSVDSPRFLQLCIQFLERNNAAIVTDKILSLVSGSFFWNLQSSSSSYQAKRVVLAAGSWTGDLIQNSPDLCQPRIRVFKDVGNAMLLHSQFAHIQTPKVNHIYRSPNRGGTCGVHAVQRSQCLYVGASSHPTHEEVTYPLMDSITAIAHSFTELTGINSRNLSFTPLVGFRPVTDDTYPIIGRLSENVFCFYGTKRDGFTWAPYYAKLSTKLLSGESCSVSASELLDICDPLRSIHSLGDVSYCINAYLESKEAEAYQHASVFGHEDKEFEHDLARQAHSLAQYKWNKHVGLHPDLIKLLLHMYS